MKTGTMRRLSVVFFGGGLLLLALSFLPRTADQRELPDTASDTAAEAAKPETAEAQTPAATTELSPEQLASEGAALFQAKGCLTCHRHDAFDNIEFSTEIGPNLTFYQPDPDFVRDWLRDPAAIRPNTAMPDLNLSGEEIEALVAFLEE
jgi:mono/diheme cytochrome c family protein